MKRALTLLFALALIAVAALGALPASADGIEVKSLAANNRFPDGIRFSIFVSAEADITQARLRYRVLPDSPVTSAAAQCTAGTAANCSVDVGSTLSSYMVPGAEVRYTWELDDAAGNHLETDEQSATYQDDRFIWEPMTEGQVTIYSYSGSQDLIKQLLDAANETIINISRIENTSLEFPVKIWVYEDAQDLSAAILSTGGQGVTEGEVYFSDTALVARGANAELYLRHEVAHVVTRRAVRSEQPVGDNYTRFDIPAWIDEGISVFAQGRLSGGQNAALTQAVRTDTVLPITSLTPSTRSTGSTIDLFYGQSGSLIAYLVNTYGEEKFGQFIQAMKSNLTDGAVQEVYGFSLLDWENEWRVNLGLPEVEDTGSTQQVQEAIPTLAPLGSLPQVVATATVAPTAASTDATPTATASGAKSDDGGSSALPIIIGVIVAVVVLAGGGFALMRRRSGPSST